MMDKFYPKSSQAVEEDVIDEVATGQAIIQGMEDGKSKEAMIGPILAGKNSVKAFSRIYAEVKEERNALASVDIRACKTQTAYKTELAKLKKYGDENTWSDKMQDTADGTWASLKELHPDYDTTPPSVPKSVKAVLTDMSVAITWGVSTAGASGLARYTLYRNGMAIKKLTDNEYSESVSVYETEYSYTVSATNGDGYESAQSTASKVTTPVEPEPEPEPEPEVVEEV